MSKLTKIDQKLGLKRGLPANLVPPYFVNRFCLYIGIYRYIYVYIGGTLGVLKSHCVYVAVYWSRSD